MFRLSPKLLIASDSKKHPIAEVQKCRERLAADMQQDPYSDTTQRQLLKYLQICTILSSTDENEKIQTVWTCALRPTMSRNLSTSFKTDALHCWFNLAVASNSLNKTLAILEHIASLVPTLYPREVPPFDFQESVLGFLLALVRAEAQAALAEKASATSPLKIKLLSETVHLYEAAVKAGERIPSSEDFETAGPREATWKKTVEAGRLRAMALVTYYGYLSIEKEVKQKLEGFGVLIQYLSVCVDALNKREKLTGGLGNDKVLIEVKELAVAALNEVQKDNNLVYHERVPTEIPEFPRVHAVKVNSEEVVSELLKEAAGLVELASLASPKVVELINSLISKLDAVKIPTEAEIIRRLDILVASGGLDGAKATLESLQSSAAVGDTFVTNIRTMLSQEAEEDARIRRNFRVTRTPSAQLTHAFTTELATLSAQLSKAREKNQEVAMRLLNLAEFSDFFNSPSSLAAPVVAAPAGSSSDGPAASTKVANWLQVMVADRESLRQEIRSLATISAPKEALSKEAGFIAKINALIPATWLRFLEALRDLETSISELKQGGDFYSAACACLARLEDDVKSYSAGRAMEVSQIMADVRR